MKVLNVAIAAVLLGLLAAAAFIWSGAYNIAADEPHFAVTSSALQTLRMRSIAVRARGLDVPDLQDPARIRRGAGNYDAMCSGCHLAPGAAPSELSNGLYPAPPNLSKLTGVDSAQAFWVIKHGIKASGMPAWGKSMDDAYIWDIVAFLEKLPILTPAQYEAEVAASGGHSHGGRESPGRGHALDSSHAPEEAADHQRLTELDHADDQSHSHRGSGSRPTASHRR